MIVESPELPKKQPQIDPPQGYRILKAGETTSKTDMQHANGLWIPARQGYKITRYSAAVYARREGAI